MGKKYPGFLGYILISTSLFASTHAFGFYISPPDTAIQKKVYTTRKIAGNPPEIDGKLTDQAWDLVAWTGDFVEFQPDGGKAPAQKTFCKVLYDDKNLYIGIRNNDTDPSKIVKRLGRRDNTDGDWAGVMIDSYNDQLTAFEFDVNAVGVNADAYISNDLNNEDYTWDPIWYVKTSIDTSGWVAEMRIPLSQLRFPDKSDQVWGLEILRSDFRTGQLSLWQYIPKNSNGFVHQFGELHGLEGLKPQKQLEIMPYVLGKIESSKRVEGNPFAPGINKTVNAGLDGKLGITSNLILDFTINPDFGQVEADPSVVNLTGFENYFSEKRPFFIESNNVLDYNLSNSIAWGPHNSDNLFYSRRIGHSPSGSPQLADNEFARVPDNTTILGAMKLTGKTQKGLSVGILESLTQKEMAKISDGSRERSQVVEPLTNYFEARVLQDFNKGNTQIGGIVTAVNRDLRNPEVDFLHRSAYTGGLDFIHNWKNKTWYVTGNFIFSQVKGAREAITTTQTSQEHLFQRTGYSRLRVDSALTELSGTGATLKFGKGGKGNIQFQGGATYRSPGIELNDMGYLYKANILDQFFWASYHIWNPWWIFNRVQFNVNQWTYWDFFGTNLYKAANYNMHMQFKNYYGIGGGITCILYRLDNDLLRGGPPLLLPGGTESFGYISSDYRKKFNMELDYNGSSGNNGYLNSQSLGLWMRYQPFKSLNFSLNPNFSINKNTLQYVTIIENNSPKYIVSEINQSTSSLTVRIDFCLAPNLTLQYYGQPFVAKGVYSAYKQITDSRATEYRNRFHQLTKNELSFDKINNTYNVDENADGQTDYSFSNPDFDFLQFRSNMVIRWEYKPGSTLFLVWTQSRSDTRLLNDHSFNSLSQNLFDIYPDDVFLIKFSYRFIR